MQSSKKGSSKVSRGKSKKKKPRKQSSIKGKDAKFEKQHKLADEDFFGNVIAEIGAGINLIDEDHVIEYQSKLLKERFGEARGKKCYKVYQGIEKPCEFCKIKDALQCGKAAGVVVTAIDGRNYGVSFVKLEKGKNAKIIEILYDLTKYRKLRDQLIKSERMSILGSIAGGVVHQFNNIHTIIQGNVQVLLMQENIPPEIREDLQIISETSRRASSISSHLVSFARGVAGKKETAFLEDIITNVLKITKREFETQGISINTQFTPELPSLVLDMAQIAQVVMNLVIHSHRAMGNSTEKVLSVKTGMEGGLAYIRVSHTGKALSKDDINKIIEPDKKPEDEDVSFLLPGGLESLAVSHSIVKDHEGRFVIESDPVKGTSFTIYLPVSESGGIESNVPEEFIDFKGLRILVIDDEPLILRLIKNALEIKNCVVEVAETGSQGVIMSARKDFDVVLVDLQIPDMQGDKILEEINKIPSLSRPLKIVMTGKPRIESIRNYQKYEIISILFKPFHLAELYSAIAACKRGKAPNIKRK